MCNLYVGLQREGSFVDSGRFSIMPETGFREYHPSRQLGKKRRLTLRCTFQRLDLTVRLWPWR